MDGHQPGQQPDYPPLQPGDEGYQSSRYHPNVPSPQAASIHTQTQQHQQPHQPSMYAPQLPRVAIPGSGGDVGGGVPVNSAMSALTAAAVANQPSPRATTMSAVPNSMPVPPSQQQKHRNAAANSMLMSSTASSTNPPPVSASPHAPGGGSGGTAAIGKVVESGHEHTGRWTKEEHEAFLSALQLYGKEWKKVAARVKTRTVVQTRTHAQKYFQKLQKVLETGGDKEANAVFGMAGGKSGIALGESPQMPPNNSYIAAMMDDLGVPNAEKKASTKKRSPSIKQSSTSAPKSSSKAKQSSSRKSEQQPQQAQYAATAAALLNMSSDRRLSSTIGPPSSNAGAYSSAGHGFSPTPMAGIDAPSPASAHGFGFAGAQPTPNPLANPSGTGISLSAIPNHEDMMQSGSKFPEPSPAACGKRKLAEIAAAQMLAGVVHATENAALSSAKGAVEPTQKKRASVTGSAAITTEGYGAGDRDAPPIVDTSSSTDKNKAPTGLSLQIVNPDRLVAQQESNGTAMPRRRLLNGQASPLTPWDGQMQALVSQVKSRESAPPPQDPSAANAMPEPSDVFMPSTQEESPAVEDNIMSLLPPPLRNPKSDLQVAVCSGSVTEVSQICSTQVTSNPSILAQQDEAGFQALHSAAALSLSLQFGPSCQESWEICKLLIDAGADVTCRDSRGNTAAHWAARAGHHDVLALLLSKNCLIDDPNDDGETALHWAMRAGCESWQSAVQVLVENGAQVNVFNRSFRRPLDVAAEGFVGLDGEEEGSADATKADQNARKATRWNLLQQSSQSRTLVLHHRECLDHLPKYEHDWEVPDRIDSIMTAIEGRSDSNAFNPCEITISTDFERATLELLSRIHSAEYLAFVNDLSKDLEKKRKQQLIDQSEANLEGDDDPMEPPNPGVVPFTPMVQRKVMKDTPKREHSDTAFSAGSLKAARRAAGAVQHAVDCVLVGRNRNAFCIVRPPGHHAGINGLLSDAESCGFCLFNNVAAGAMHALSDEKHRPRCERCAIVDVDAHHGNGTEEIVRKCHDSGRLLFFSVHLYDYDKPPKKAKENTDGSGFQYKFYPGTGLEDDVAHNIINVPIAPLWREKEVVKSLAMASNGGANVVEPRQTRQRSKDARRVPSLPDLTKYKNDNPLLKPSAGSQIDSASVTSDSSAQSSKAKQTTAPATPSYPPHYNMGVGRLAYRRAIEQRLLPALRAFNPDLIILSTGLDAAKGDVGNARHYNNGTEAMGLDLLPEDYAWTARKVCQVADICCDGRVVSVLEGGYGRTPPAIPPPPPLFADDAAGEPPKQKLDKSFFTECAIQHLKGLVDPYDEDEQS